MKTYKKSMKGGVTISVTLTPRKRGKLYGHSKGFSVRNVSVDKFYKLLIKLIEKEEK